MYELPDLLRSLADTRDPIERLTQAHQLALGLNEAAEEARRVRRETLIELAPETGSGWSQAKLAEILGVSRARIGQLLRSGPSPERALLGIGRLTICVAGKQEAPKRTGGITSTVISEQMQQARDLLVDTADAYGLDSALELVHPGESPRLDRPNLIVLGSPRLLPVMTNILTADPELGFGQGRDGRWFLTDRLGEPHQSPLDSGGSSDCAYLGRLPRSDGRGTLLYLAGVHAPGTLGAAQHLTNHMEGLYEQVKHGRWSMLIEADYDPNTGRVTDTRPITPTYQH